MLHCTAMHIRIMSSSSSSSSLITHLPTTLKKVYTALLHCTAQTSSSSSSITHHRQHLLLGNMCSSFQFINNILSDFVLFWFNSVNFYISATKSPRRSALEAKLKFVKLKFVQFPAALVLCPVMLSGSVLALRTFSWV